jgi:hypothetical protein
LGKFIDLTGQRFGRLVVIKKAKNINQRTAWLCKCDCNKKSIMVNGKELKNGHTKSCGCLRKDLVTKMNKNKVVILTGQKFGRLTVLKREGSNKDGKAIWLCQCDCGNKIIIASSSLRKNDGTRSCGCLIKELISKRNKESAKWNGNSNTRLYVTWHNIIRRCECNIKKETKGYKDRGITVCFEWHDFNNFKNWALNNGYEDNLTIDRINNDGNYVPENCRFTDMITQSNNKRNNHRITHNGITKTLTEWSRYYGISTSTITGRIKRNWSKEDLFSPSYSKK